MWGPQGPSIFYLRAYLAFPPCTRLLSISSVPLSSSPVPRTIAWALVCPCKLSRDSLALMAQLNGAPMLICACSVSAAYLGVLFLIGLGLEASCWLVLGMTC